MSTIATHNGSFHTDDVFAVATIQLYLGDTDGTVIRTRHEQLINEADFVVDVGEVYDPTRQRFDHHQSDAPVRENGIPYSAFGMVWQVYGEAVSGSPELAAWLDRTFVQSIDASDNGRQLFEPTEPGLAPFTLDQVIDTFRPHTGTKSADEAFLEAVTFAKQLLLNLIEQEKVAAHMRADAEQIYALHDDKTILTTTHPISPDAFAHLPDVRVVVKPRTKHEDTDWIARIIPFQAGTTKNRAHFPASWAGLRNAELAAASGITDAVFCHKQRYLFVARSEAGAHAAANQAVPADSTTKQT